MIIVGTHNHVLVALSILIAIAASFTALDLASRIRASIGWAQWAWLATAALAMGGGIWAMHFVAMLAFGMPNMQTNYDVGLTLVSLVVPIVVTGVSFGVMGQAHRSPVLLPAAGLVMGLSIVAMHYLGMAAMKMPADLAYDPLWVALSVLIAIGAATVALWLSIRTSHLAERAGAAIAMGVAVSGMHFSAMQGVVLTAQPGLVMTHGQPSLDQVTLATVVAAAAFLILSLALIAAMFDRRFALLVEREASALRRSEERFRLLYKRTPLPLHSLDQEGRIEHVSDAWLDLMGYRRAEVVGRPLINFMTEASACQAVQEDWPLLLREGKLREVEYRVVTKEGGFLDVLASARVERDDHGIFLRALGGLTNVTERKRTEKALRQSQKIETIGQLTGGVAHDFNNLLAVVLGNLELLRKRLLDDPKAARFLENAYQGAQRGAGLTQRLLAFARRQDLKPEPVEVPGLVQGMADLLQRSLGPMVRISTQFPLRLSSVLVDANQLELALLNLAVNARDAMPEGGMLTITASEQTVIADNAHGLAPGRYVCLSLMDTGSGMDLETLARATEPFFTTKGPGQGTGLGLSMVQGVAAQSGGRLVLSSKLEVGTTAELWLPAVPEVPRSQPADPAIGASVAEASPLLTILVVDDDPMVLTNMAAMLEDLGHTVLQVSSGGEALAMLKTTPGLDLVITDQAMPGMSGAQLAEAIKSEQPRLPVLLVSGYAPSLSETGCRLLKLNKPFDQAALTRAVADAVRPASGANVVPLRLQYG